MTPEQKTWLEANPRYSPVRRVGVVALKKWTDEGWLFGNGRFAVDDGKTLFVENYPAWFAGGDRHAIRVGRHYDIV